MGAFYVPVPRRRRHTTPTHPLPVGTVATHDPANPSGFSERPRDTFLSCRTPGEVVRRSLRTSPRRSYSALSQAGAEPEGIRAFPASAPTRPHWLLHSCRPPPIATLWPRRSNPSAATTWFLPIGEQSPRVLMSATGRFLSVSHVTSLRPWHCCWLTRSLCLCWD